MKTRNCSTCKTVLEQKNCSKYEKLSNSYPATCTPSVHFRSGFPRLIDRVRPNVNTFITWLTPWARYSFFFSELMNFDSVSVHKHAKQNKTKNLANISSWPNAWSIPILIEQGKTCLDPNMYLWSVIIIKKYLLLILLFFCENNQSAIQLHNKFLQVSLKLINAWNTAAGVRRKELSQDMVS